MQAKIKIENGEFWAQEVETTTPWFKLPNQIRASEDVVMRISPWLDPQNGAAAWIMDKICMTMLCDPRLMKTNEFYSPRNSGDKSYHVIYNNPVVVVCPRIDRGHYYLVDKNGEVLSGSNIFSLDRSSGGNLCLGSSVDPFSLTAIEALIYNKANRDLTWVGQALQGTWEKNKFIITTWPTARHKIWTPPQQIIENINAWSTSS